MPEVYSFDASSCQQSHAQLLRRYRISIQGENFNERIKTSGNFQADWQKMLHPISHGKGNGNEGNRNK